MEKNEQVIAILIGVGVGIILGFVLGLVLFADEQESPITPQICHNSTEVVFTPCNLVCECPDPLRCPEINPCDEPSLDYCLGKVKEVNQFIERMEELE